MDIFFNLVTLKEGTVSVWKEATLRMLRGLHKATNERTLCRLNIACSHIGPSGLLNIVYSTLHSCISLYMLTHCFAIKPTCCFYPIFCLILQHCDANFKHRDNIFFVNTISGHCSLFLQESRSHFIEQAKEEKVKAFIFLHASFCLYIVISCYLYRH